MVVELRFTVTAMDSDTLCLRPERRHLLEQLVVIFDGWPPQGASLDEPEGPVFIA
jgi:hypothetical protein